MMVSSNQACCSLCGSERIISVSAKTGDLCVIQFKSKRFLGNLPKEIGIGGGEYLELRFCLQCGRIQNDFPRLHTSLESDAQT
ncbi:MAG: hypothetical protein SFU91_14790 [Chloroherpetonaceae bacterium]|nr:hypothetical protein [Chloroherpetonaceae bacterium]